MRFVAKWLSQLLLVLAALFAGEWSLFDVLHLVQPNGEVQFGSLHAKKAVFQLAARLVFSIFAIAMVVAVDILDVYLPRNELRKFRAEYLNGKCLEWHDRPPFNSGSLRVNVLYAKRRLYWPFWRVFHWSWSEGFKPPFGHSDANLVFACWQGISGQAFKTGVSKSAFGEALKTPQNFGARFLLWNKFRFTPYQLEKTKGIQGLVCIPILRKSSGEAVKYKAVGVITIDAYDAAAAKILQENEIPLVEYFFELGILLGSLDV